MGFLPGAVANSILCSATTLFLVTYKIIFTTIYLLRYYQHCKIMRPVVRAPLGRIPINNVPWLAVSVLYERTKTQRRLLGSASEQPQNNPDRCRVIVLMQVRAEARPVIIEIEHTDLEVSRWMNIQSAADLKRQAVV